MATQDDPELERWVDDRLATLAPDQEGQPDVDRGLAELDARRAQATKRKPIGTWLVGAAVAVWIGAMVVTLVPRPADNPGPGANPEASPGDRAVSADARRPTPAGSRADDGATPARTARESVLTQVSERQDAPHFTLPDADGGNAMLADYTGRVLLLNFWATWCGPCKVEMPWFVDFEDRYGDEGFAVVGVSVDEPGWEIVRPFLDNQPLNYRIALADTPERLAPFGEMYVLPKSWLIDREGRIAAEHIGLVDRDSIEGQIQELLSE